MLRDRTSIITTTAVIKHYGDHSWLSDLPKLPHSSNSLSILDSNISTQLDVKEHFPY